MKKRIIIILLLFTLSFSAFADKLFPEVKIRFYDKKVYTLNSDIKILVELVNKTDSDITFNLADNRMYNIVFKVKTLTNLPCEVSDYYIQMKNNPQPYFYKEMTLKPREKFSFIESLNKYIVIEKTGKYIIQTYYYNDFIKSKNSPIKSNTLNLTIKSMDKYNESKTKQIVIKNEDLRPINMEPDKVIRYMLNSRKANDWNRFFACINLKTIYTKNSSRKIIYNKQTENERENLIKDYKELLKEEKTDKQIVATPSYYSIEKTTYTDTEASVIAVEYFKFRNFTEKKEYRYKLNKIDKIWIVYDYEVKNLGTIK